MFKNYTDYTDYIAILDRTIQYTEYISEQVNRTINYSDYWKTARDLDRTNSRKDKIKSMFK